MAPSYQYVKIIPHRRISLIIAEIIHPAGSGSIYMGHVIILEPLLLQLRFMNAGLPAGIQCLQYVAIADKNAVHPAYKGQTRGTL